MNSHAQLTWWELLKRMKEEGTLSEKAAIAVTTSLKNQTEEPSTPISLRVLYGLGAWLAAPFLMTFPVLFGANFGPGVYMVLGLAGLGLSVGLHRIFTGVFGVQFTLAIAAASHLIVLSGIHDTVGSTQHVSGMFFLTLAQAVTTAAVYPFYRDRVYRFLMPAMAVALATGWMLDGHRAGPGFIVLFTAELAAVYYIFLRNSPGVLRPLGYVAVCALPVQMLLVVGPRMLGFYSRMGSAHYSMILGAILAAALAGLIIETAGRNNIRKEWMIMAIGGAVLLALLHNGGVILTLGLLILGHKLDNNIIKGVASTFLLVFLVWFYYDMRVDLAYKSWVLGGSGLLLIGARFVLGRRPWAAEAEQ